MDIVERLREGKSAGGYWREKEAADEIERLREERQRLRYGMECIADVSECRTNSLLSQINEMARAALKEGE